LANSQASQVTCALSLQLLRPQGTTAGGVVQAYNYRASTFLGLNQGSSFPISSIVVWTRGLVMPRLRFQLEAKRNVRASLSISPPAPAEFQVQVTSPNLFAGARLVTVPAGASEVDFIVQNFHNPNSPFGVDSYAVNWGIIGSAASNYQQRSSTALVRPTRSIPKPYVAATITTRSSESLNPIETTLEFLSSTCMETSVWRRSS